MKSRQKKYLCELLRGEISHAEGCLRVYTGKDAKRLRWELMTLQEALKIFEP
jgi:hypothetical protein